MTLPRVAIVGAGAFGQNHCRVVHESERAELAAIVDSNSERAAELAAKYNTTALTDAHDLVGRADAAIIAVPTIRHAEIGCLLLDSGLDVLVEKPIATDLA
jgi:predicted dehydrogenase